jgi:sugar/nucleoside kinase (ribokinase family)
MNSKSLHAECADRLLAAAAQPGHLSAFVGLDGFVDEILHVVDKRESATSYHRLPTIAQFAARLAAAAGKSTNVELVNQRTKLGGNGPIMANTLATFGLRVTYLGNLGYPSLHPVFADLGKRAEVHSIADPGHTDALEFDDGKVMLGKHTSLKEVNWENIVTRFGRDKLDARLQQADLVAFVNWTMLPHMSGIWEAILGEICPGLNGPRRKIFFDLADPEKREAGDIRHALDLIGRFQRHFDVLLGLNEKEAFEVGAVLGIQSGDRSREDVASMALEIWRRLKIDTVAIHPVTYALAAHDGKVDIADGPYVPKPLITTGAGDHFNAGFCLGKLLGLDNRMCVLTGVTTSGYYVRTAQSPEIAGLAAMLQDWPDRQA